MRRAAAVLVAALLTALVPTSAGAQSASVLLVEGIGAYDDLEFVAASRLLRRALSPSLSPPLAPDERDRALMYLGAAALFLRNRSEAVTTLRRLVVTNPRYRPDRMKFPPDVTQVFDETLQTTKAVAVEVPSEQTLTPGADRFHIRLYASSNHWVRVAVLGPRGDTLQTLHDGPIADSLVVQWNGLDVLGQTPTAGTYRLEAVSLVVPGPPLRTVRIPLEIARSRAEPLQLPPTPPDSLFLPAQRPGRRQLGVLVPGLVAGAALALPAAAGAGGAEGVRIGLGGALMLGSVVAYLAQKADKPIPENIAHNDSLRAEWSRRTLEVTQQNRRLAAVVRLVIRAGPAERVEGSGG